MRHLYLAAALLAAAAPASAQHDHPAPAAQGAHKLPAGWHGRTDRANQSIGNVMFMAMGNGFHVKTGPASILWNASHQGKGNFTASATFSATKQPATEAYGLVFGGSKLNQDDVDYAYFVVRGDGSYLIRHRAGAELHTITPWTKHAAVRTADANGAVTNRLAVEAGASAIRFLVNGTEVASFKRNEPMRAEGVVGLRVNHNLELMISDFNVTKK